TCEYSGCMDYLYIFFFFQAEDGIRDGHVTGVQTCALPISTSPRTEAWGRDWDFDQVPPPGLSSRGRWPKSSCRHWSERFKRNSCTIAGLSAPRTKSPNSVYQPPADASPAKSAVHQGPGGDSRSGCMCVQP